MPPTKLSNDSINAAMAMDKALYSLRRLDLHPSVAGVTPIADELGEALDALSWEPRDVRDLRYALASRGYTSHTIMLPGQESIDWDLDAEDYAAVQDLLRSIEQNDGLLLTVRVEDHAVDQHGMPYILVTVSREVSSS